MKSIGFFLVTISLLLCVNTLRFEKVLNRISTTHTDKGEEGTHHGHKHEHGSHGFKKGKSKGTKGEKKGKGKVKKVAGAQPPKPAEGDKPKSRRRTVPLTRS